MQKEFISHSALETISIGEKIGKLLNKGDVVLLEADLAGGKTTITKGIGKGVGVSKNINSPTFTIVKSYMGKCPFYHLDLYRLDGVNNDFDLEEYFNEESICVVEWPHQVDEVLPSSYLKISLSKLGDDERKIILSSNDEHYDRIVEGLK